MFKRSSCSENEFQEKSGTKQEKSLPHSNEIFHSAGGVMTNVKGVKEWHTATIF